jgi:hypothetical protein
VASAIPFPQNTPRMSTKSINVNEWGVHCLSA